MKQILIYGGTGQAKMVKCIADSMYRPFEKIIYHLIDETATLNMPFDDIEGLIKLGPSAYEKMLKELPNENHEIEFAIAIGNPHGKRRLELTKLLYKDNFIPKNWIHTSAIIDESVKYGFGNQIHPAAIINPQVKMGNSNIINTRALVEHGCELGSGVEIGPGAILCGQIKVMDYAWIGAGAVIKPNLKIGKNSIIGAGSVVTKDVPDNEIVIGVPAKKMLR